MAVEDVLGAELVAYSEYEPSSKSNPKPTQAAARLLAYRRPGVPNLGDIAAIDWAAVAATLDRSRALIVTGGFPCQDLSLAGIGKGMRAGTRSGLWTHMAHGIDQLRPDLVLIENVRGLLSADAACDLEPCPWCLGDDEGRPLRALGAVLGDLAELGFDARWVGLRAADVGAPHGRFRVFVAAWPAADTHSGAVRDEPVAQPGGDGAPVAGPPVRDTDSVDRDGWAPAGLEGQAGPAAGPAPDPARVGRGTAGGHDGLRPAGLESCPTTDTTGDGRDEGWTESARFVGRPDAAVCGDAVRDSSMRGRDVSPVAEGRGKRAEQARGSGVAVTDADCGRNAEINTRTDEVDGQRSPNGRRPVKPTWALRGGITAGRGASGELSAERGPITGDQTPDRLDWGPYGPAIHRWQSILGRVAPAPTQVGARGGTQLSARFVEFLMGLPEGYVTDVPGLTRNEQLARLGNGVVPQQAVAALQHLLAFDTGRAAA